MIVSSFDLTIAVQVLKMDTTSFPKQEMENLPVEVVAHILRSLDSPTGFFVCGLWFDLFKNFLKKNYNVNEFIKDNNYKLVDWALENGCPLDMVLCTASKFGNLAMLTEYSKRTEQIDYKQICSYAIKYSKINVLRWVHKRGIIFDQDLANSICMATASFGNNDGFSFLFCEVGYKKENVDWKGVCEEAALCGHILVLQHVHRYMAFSLEFLSSIDKIRLIFYGIKGGHCEIIKFGYDYLYSFDEDCCAEAIRNNNLEILTYIRNLGCPWGREVGKMALENGNLEILQYLKNNGYPFTANELELVKEKNLIL